jgi:hypothetical protein
MYNQTQNDSIRRDRSGMSTVEFALLLPFFALFAAGLFSLDHLFYRSVCQSHAGFAAARRCAVKGGTGPAERLVSRDYRASSIPGKPQVRSRFTAGRPGVCTLEILDRGPFLIPGVSGRLLVQRHVGALTIARAVGVSDLAGGDNDR